MILLKAGENQDATRKYRYFMDLSGSEHLANRLLIFVVGRDPQIELKEQTKVYDQPQ